MKVLDELRKKWGDGLIRKGEDIAESIYVIPTGSLNLDLALGIGGIPKGRITEIIGEESTGKTTLVQYVIAEAQKQNGLCVLIDMEHALDPAWASKCGVNINDLYLVQPDYGEQALDIVEAFARSGEVDFIGVDSVTTLVPKAEIEGEMGDSHMGLQARLMSQALRKITPALKSNNCSLVFTNQYRSKIGQIWGNPNVPTGGNSLKYYASVRIELRRGEAQKAEGEQTGNKIKATIIKNKLAPPYKACVLTLDYGVGLDYIGEIIELSTDLGFLQKSGAGWFTIEDRKIQGLANVKAEMDKNPQLLQSLEDKVRTYYGLPIRRFE